MNFWSGCMRKYELGGCSNMYKNTNKKTTKCLVLGGWVFKYISKYKKYTDTKKYKYN